MWGGIPAYLWCISGSTHTYEYFDTNTCEVFLHLYSAGRHYNDNISVAAMQSNMKYKNLMLVMLRIHCYHETLSDVLLKNMMLVVLQLN